LVIEERPDPTAWVIDYSRWTTTQRVGSDNANSVLIARCKTLLSLAHGYINMQDAYSFGHVRTGTTDKPRSLAAIRALSALLRAAGEGRGRLEG
jgi:hypothetical protein